MNQANGVMVQDLGFYSKLKTLEVIPTYLWGGPLHCDAQEESQCHTEDHKLLRTVISARPQRSQRLLSEAKLFDGYHDLAQGHTDLGGVG